MVITIDGAAGVGKTSTAKEIAKRLGYQYFDTGAMYRAVTFFFIKKNVDLSSNSQVVESLKAIKLQIDFSSESEMQIFLGEENISLKIRSQEVTSKVSAVSALKDVREMMVKIQRSFTESGNFVVEGRDIGTVVFPDAKYKFYLQADYDIRAKRRLVDFEKINEAKNINEIKEDLETRDKYDSTRKLSPLKKPEDAIIIDTTLCSFEEQVNQILKHIEK
jgi:cytidylate kinase|tara:strand:- start:27366 stop:28022 length:657 start_codon:yes stop_codon:yes gene_type:complete